MTVAIDWENLDFLYMKLPYQLYRSLQKWSMGPRTM